MPAQTQIMHRQLCKQQTKQRQRQRQGQAGGGREKKRTKTSWQDCIGYIWCACVYAAVRRIRTMVKGIANVAEGTNELSMGVCKMWHPHPHPHLRPCSHPYPHPHPLETGIKAWAIQCL